MSQADAKNFKKQFEQLKVGLKFGLSGSSIWTFEVSGGNSQIYLYDQCFGEFSSAFGVVMPASGWSFSEVLGINIVG